MAGGDGNTRRAHAAELKMQTQRKIRGLPVHQVPAVYHRRLGDLMISTVSDGYVDPPLDVVQVVSQVEVTRLIMAGLGKPTPRISVNMFAVRSAEKTYLVDAGSGTTMGPTCGRLPANLAAAGIALEEVDAVLLTHVHPDHSNGLTSDDGKALFPNAEIIVHENEIAFWFDDAAMAAATPRARTRYFEAARFRLAPYKGRIRTFREGEVLPAISGIPCPGHTPGHSAYRFSSGGEDLLIWGDTVHIPELQVPRPDITMLYDTDQPLAAASRVAMFDLAVRGNLLIGGMHLHFPGFARMARENGGYRILTEPWAYTL
jgi:glyoxylase-like metal-dependent hydrolase (beta-lactamase superfamily II)